MLSVESQVEDFTNTIKLDFNNFQTKANETLAGVSGVANITIAAHDAVAAHAGTGTAAARKADEANKKSDDKDALK